MTKRISVPVTEATRARLVASGGSEAAAAAEAVAAAVAPRPLAAAEAVRRAADVAYLSIEACDRPRAKADRYGAELAEAEAAAERAAAVVRDAVAQSLAGTKKDTGEAPAHRNQIAAAARVSDARSLVERRRHGPTPEGRREAEAVAAASEIEAEAAAQRLDSACQRWLRLRAAHADE